MSGDDFSWVMIGVGIGWLVMGGLGLFVSGQKNRPLAEGLILGLLLGPLGVLIAALLPTQTLEQLKAAQESPSRADPNDVMVPRQFYHHKDLVVWTCRCGKQREAKASLKGQISACPKCRQRTATPG